MGKSTSLSATRKKSSKHSSRGRNKKRSKTRRSKSKKLRRRDHSFSYSDDDSRSSVSASSSSSADLHRSGRSRVRSRKDVKGSKKRARSLSSSSEDSHYERKRRRSKKVDGSAAKKKRNEKKKKKKGKKITRRESSISSRSSESLSCSTCSSHSSDESEYERRRGRSERRGYNKRKLDSIKVERNRRYRSRSCSSCSRDSGTSDSSSEKKVTCEDNSKRLKSIITRANKDEGKELETNGHKEEMVYDHDDYPSSRSNDSNDGGYKRESAHQLPSTSKIMPSNGDGQKEDSLVSKIETTKPKENNKDREGQFCRSRHAYDRTGTNETKNEVSVVDGSVNGEELESFLRKKALENLRLFRGGSGGLQTNSECLIKQKDGSKCSMETLSSAVAKSGPTKFPKNDSAGGIPEDFSYSLPNDEIIVNNMNGGSKSYFVKNKINPPLTMAVTGTEKVKITNGSSISKSRLVTSTLKKALTSSVTKPTEQYVTEESDHAKLVTPNFVCENIAQTAHGESPPTSNGNGNTDKGSIASSSTSVEQPASLKSGAGDISLNRVRDESKEGSKYQQKTMSVMRGGEMVQVSYKVYIPPKKTPAARRQLNR